MMINFPKRARMQCLDTLSRWLVALVFLVAAISKMFDLEGFAKNIEAYGLVPDALLYPAAILVVVVEIVGGVGLLLKKRAALHLISALLFVFTVVLGYSISIGLDIDCGCFSTSDPEHKAFAGLRMALVRDVLLFLPLLWLYWRSNFLLNRSLSEN